jgi:AraC-like DNA-binding protein
MGARLVGVRLRPGVAGAALGLPADELRDVSPDAADVLGPDAVDRLAERLAAGADPHALLLDAVARAAGPPDPLVQAAIVALDRPNARVATVAAELGLSARQLQRRVSAAVGYGPKTLARVLRFRRLQSLPHGPLVERALEAGYADQAHMTAEVTALAGLPPVRFLKDRAPIAA